MSRGGNRTEDSAGWLGVPAGYFLIGTVQAGSRSGGGELRAQGPSNPATQAAHRYRAVKLGVVARGLSDR